MLAPHVVRCTTTYTVNHAVLPLLYVAICWYSYAVP